MAPTPNDEKRGSDEGLRVSGARGVPVNGATEEVGFLGTGLPVIGQSTVTVPPGVVVDVGPLFLFGDASAVASQLRAPPARE